MSHLREQLSAHIDGELTGTALDRTNAHLASCEQCRAEAVALRALKRELRHLAAARPSEDFTRRLLAMAGPGGPALPRHHLPAASRQRPAFRAYPDRPRPRPGHLSGRPHPSRPAPHAPGDSWARRRRGHYLVWGALSFIVTVGIGAAAFSLGELSGPSGARITPQMELFSIEHALMGGNVPMLDPSQAPSHKPIGPRPDPRLTTP